MRKKTKLGVIIPCIIHKYVKMSIRAALLWQTDRARKLGIDPPDADAVQQMFVAVVESGFKCIYCGIEFEWGDRALHPTIDHRIPISRGGNNETDNLGFCCWRCNRLKRDLTDDEYISLVSMVEDRYKTSWIHNERFSREIGRLKTAIDYQSLGVYTASKRNWGYILALRTGPADLSKILVTKLKVQGYKLDSGSVLKRGSSVPVRTEHDMFRMAGIKYREATARV